MNKQFLRGLSTLTLTTVLGTTAFLGGSQHQSLASDAAIKSLGNQSQSEAKTQASNSEVPLPNSENPISEDESPLSTETTIQENPIATIYSHRWKGLQVVTLRIRNIPLLMFLGGIIPSVGTQANVTDLSQMDPVARAKSLAERLNQLSQEPFDGRQIRVNWNKDSKTYQINLKGEVLVNLDQATRLPDSTNNLAADALQMTNRLRRLLGDAPPLSSIDNKTPETAQNNAGKPIRQKRGVASWYGPGFHGRRTANGERYNQHGFTAAHRFLPFGTKVRVTNLQNGRSVVVRINDRGPFSRGRIIDLSAGAAKLIGVFSNGTATVALEIMGR